jgi:hypothetical protein
MPLFVMLPRKTMPDRKMIINLNNYRNWHSRVSNQVKILYKEAATPKIEELRFILPIKLTFTLWKGSLRKTDRANVLSVTEKFFCDALTECGCIVDDCDEYIRSTRYVTGGIDRDNPRVDILMQEVED